MAIINMMGGGDGAWNIKIIKIDESVQLEIPNAYFRNNTLVYKASFPYCSTIGASAFDGCKNLTDIFFPICETIGASAFKNCTALTEFTFPSCTTIASSAFQSCSAIKASFPVCTSIGGSAFANCDIGEVFLPVCSSVASGAFTSMSGYLHLGSFNINMTYASQPWRSLFGIPSSVYSSYTYASYVKLSGIDIPSMVQVPGYAFYSASNLVTAKAQIATEIGQAAFQNCFKLHEISFPSCRYIGSSAFSGCTHLQEASFPSCSTIESSAFAACYSLISLYLMGSYVVDLRHSSAFYYSPINGYTSYTEGVYGSIYVPESLLSSYKTATNWTRISSRFVGL